MQKTQELSANNIMSDKTSLGDRMKDYETRSRFFLQRRTYTIIRIDGKAFHTFCRGMEKPFDQALSEAMVETTRFLCQNVQGCKLGYTQSDEISLLLTDFDKIGTDAFFDGQVQKICSVTASFATAKFNSIFKGDKLAFFDARCFNLPDLSEVTNYFIWRQRDCVKNSISSVAQSLYSHKELMHKNSNQKQELIFQKGINWNDYPDGLKRGFSLTKEEKFIETDDGDIAKRRVWQISTPDFAADSESFFKNLTNTK